MELIIGPRLYSTWSLRPWLVLKRCKADFTVREEIISALGMREPNVFVRDFDRPNIHLAVERVFGATAGVLRATSTGAIPLRRMDAPSPWWCIPRATPTVPSPTGTWGG